MAQFDMPLEELQRYRPVVPEPEDFVEFWTTSVAEARDASDAVRIERVDAGLSEIVVDDVTFSGFGGHPIKAWLRRPASARPDEPLPAVVQYLGYGGGRGLPHEDLTWAAAGFAHLVMDSRGQGAHWGSGGETPDPAGRSAGVAGFVTAGIDDPHEHYYRRFYTDAVRAVDAVRTLPNVDRDRVAVAGTSQGGGAAIAAASVLSMLGEPVWATLPNVPFLQDVGRAVQIVDSRPYGELTQYLSVRRDAAETAWRTMSYLDGVNLAKYADAPALYSVALMDLTCPPSTVFGSFNEYGVKAAREPEKRIDVYPYNDHEGGQAYQWLNERRFLEHLS